MPKIAPCKLQTTLRHIEFRQFLKRICFYTYVEVCSENGDVLVVKIKQFVPINVPEIFTAIKKEVEPQSTLQKMTSISQIASECITGIQQGLIRVQKTVPKLYAHSMACNFFGANSLANIQKKINNQMGLTWLKTRDEDLVNFPQAFISYGPKDKKISKAFNKLKEKGFGRLTVFDKLFGNGTKDGTHTVGIVYHKVKYYILDSIPETYSEIKDFHRRLINFLKLNPKDVMFSNKPQQSMTEYTCNNWTHANLDAVMNYIKHYPEKDLTPEVFDKILPENINKILDEQYIYTFGEMRGRDLSELIMEHYNKTHKFIEL